MISSPVPEARNSPPYSKVSRSRMVCRGSRGLLASRSWTLIAEPSDPVAGLGDRVDDRRVAELAAQPADGDLHRGGERVGHLVPHPLEQFLGRDHPALGGEQQLEHPELLRAEVQGAAATA